MIVYELMLAFTDLILDSRIVKLIYFVMEVQHCFLAIGFLTFNMIMGVKQRCGL